MKILFGVLVTIGILAGVLYSCWYVGLKLDLHTHQVYHCINGEAKASLRMPWCRYCK